MIHEEDGNRPRRIALAVDTSEHTKHAFAWCLGNFCLPHDTLVLIHVATKAEDDSHEKLDPEMIKAEAEAEARARELGNKFEFPEQRDANLSVELFGEECKISGGWQVLMQYIHLCKKSKLDCKAVLARGEPGPAFVEAASALDCDLAVVGSRCLGAIKRALRASVSNHAILHIAFPVIVVRWGLTALDFDLLNTIYRPKEATQGAVRRKSEPRLKGMEIIKQAAAEFPEELSRSPSLPGALAMMGRLDQEAMERPGSAGSGESSEQRPERTKEEIAEELRAAILPEDPMAAVLGRKKKRRIGVGVDGSIGAKTALRWVFENYYRQGDIILLINCQPLQFNPGAGYGAGTTYMALEEKVKKKGTKVLRRYTRMCNRAGVRCTQIFARGDPHSELAQVAEQHR